MKPVYIIGLTVSFGGLLVLVEFLGFSATLPQLQGNITIEAWRESFLIGAGIGVGIAGAVSLLWYGYAKWTSSKIDNFQDTEGKRKIWVLLLFFSIVGSAVCALIVKSGSIFIYPVFALNGGLCYYLSTLLCSPSAFRYIPWGASRIY